MKTKCETSEKNPTWSGLEIGWCAPVSRMHLKAPTRIGGPPWHFLFDTPVTMHFANGHTHTPSVLCWAVPSTFFCILKRKKMCAWCGIGLATSWVIAHCNNHPTTTHDVLTYFFLVFSFVLFSFLSIPSFFHFFQNR